MSMPRRNPKRDLSEPEIVKALIGCGFSVWRQDQPVDLLVGFRGRCWLVECKTGKAQLNDNQKAFSASWRGPPIVVLRDAQEAAAWAQEQSKGAAHG